MQPLNSRLKGNKRLSDTLVWTDAATAAISRSKDVLAASIYSSFTPPLMLLHIVCYNWSLGRGRRCSIAAVQQWSVASFQRPWIPPRPGAIQLMPYYQCILLSLCYVSLISYCHCSTFKWGLSKYASTTPDLTVPWVGQSSTISQHKVLNTNKLSGH